MRVNPVLGSAPAFLSRGSRETGLKMGEDAWPPGFIHKADTGLYSKHAISSIPYFLGCQFMSPWGPVQLLALNSHSPRAIETLCGAPHVFNKTHQLPLLTLGSLCFLAGEEINFHAHAHFSSHQKLLGLGHRGQETATY